MPPIRRAEVVVVGAGIAGLVTAQRLHAHGIDVHVLEARDRVGGRTLNHTLSDGEIVEAGGQFVGPTQDHVLALAEDLGIATFPAYDDGKSTYVNGSAVRRFSGDIPPDYVTLPELALLMARLRRLASKIDLSAPWDSPGAAALDRITTEAWVKRFSWGRGTLELLDVLLGSAYGTSAAEASALFTIWYVAGAGNETTPGTLDRMIGVANGAQESRFVGGSQRISTSLADRLQSRVHLGSPVRRIAQDADRVRVVTDDQAWAADQVVVTVPPHLVSKMEFEPALPPQQAALFAQMTFGTLMKCEAVYTRPFWRDRGLSGQGVFRRADGPICSMFDNSPPAGGQGVLMGFLGADRWRKYANLPAEQRRGAVLRDFAKVVGPEALTPVDYFEQDWTAEPWTLGGPTSVLGPGVLTTLGRWRDVPHGAVHWAGAEHADHWNGFMDGAVRSGHETATALINRRGLR